MQAYVELTDAEVDAIYAYLKTVPPLEKAVARAPRTAAPARASSGEQIYFKYSCQSCHGTTGVGLCDLTASLGKYPTDESLASFIRNPALTTPGSKMPAWEGVIEESEYPALTRYVRSLGGR
jgi:mono/diheme cytochrome c family protein